MNAPHTRTVASWRAQAYMFLARMVGVPAQGVAVEGLRGYGFSGFQDALEWLELADLVKEVSKLQVETPGQSDKPDERNQPNEPDLGEVARTMEQLALLCHEEALAWRNDDVRGAEACLWDQHRHLTHLRSLLEHSQEVTLSMGHRLTRIAREYAARDALLVDLLLQALQGERKEATPRARPDETDSIG